MSQSEKMNALIHLAGEVAHELNNIFTAVTGNLSLLSEQARLEGVPAGMIEEISRTAQRGIALSQKLQAFAGRQPLKRKPVDIGRVLLESVRELGETLPRTVQLSLTRAAPGCISFVDEDKLRGTLQELAANAVAAMQGRGTLRLDVTQQPVAADNDLQLRPGVYACIRVVDSGPGMAPDVAARALDPLFSTRTSHISAGWGLSNCAGFLRQSGGCMHLRTTIGAGTVVELYFPMNTLATGKSYLSGGASAPLRQSEVS
jgi:signal transduction histidine kinase